MMATKQDGTPEKEEITKVNANTRLHDLLFTLSVKSSAVITGDVVATAMGVSDATGAKAMMKAAAVLHKMMEAADREIEYYLPKQVSFYLPTMNEIREAISLSKWGVPWNHVKANLTASHLSTFFIPASA